MTVEVSLALIDCDARSYREAAQDNKGKGRSSLSLDSASPVSELHSVKAVRMVEEKL